MSEEIPLMLLPIVCVAAGLFVRHWVIGVLIAFFASALLMALVNPSGLNLYEELGAGVAGAIVALVSHGIRIVAIWLWRAVQSRPRAP